MSFKKIKKRKEGRIATIPIEPFVREAKPAKVVVFQPAPWPEDVLPHGLSADELWAWMMGMDVVDKKKRGAFGRATRDLSWQKKIGTDGIEEIPSPRGTVLNIVFAGRFGDLGFTTDIEDMFGYQARLQVTECWTGEDAEGRMHSNVEADLQPEEPFLDHILPYFAMDAKGIANIDIERPVDENGNVLLVVLPNKEAWELEHIYTLIREQPRNG